MQRASCLFRALLYSLARFLSLSHSQARTSRPVIAATWVHQVRPLSTWKGVVSSGAEWIRLSVVPHCTWSRACGWAACETGRRRRINAQCNMHGETHTHTHTHTCKFKHTRIHTRSTAKSPSSNPGQLPAHLRCAALGIVVRHPIDADGVRTL